MPSNLELEQIKDSEIKELSNQLGAILYTLSRKSEYRPKPDSPIGPDTDTETDAGADADTGADAGAGADTDTDTNPR